MPRLLGSKRDSTLTLHCLGEPQLRNLTLVERVDFFPFGSSSMNSRSTVTLLFILSFIASCSSFTTCTIGTLTSSKEASGKNRPLLLVASSSNSIATTVTGGGVYSTCSGSAIKKDPFLDAIHKFELGKKDDAVRIFHGRGNLFPGYEHLTLDWFPPVLLLTSFKELAEKDVSLYCDVLDKRWKECFSSDAGNATTSGGHDIYKNMNLVYQCRATAPTTTLLIAGNVPDKHVVTENGDKYHIKLLKGQNHGLFLDMQTGRRWVKRNANNESVLNMFAYTCAFSIAALNGGASEVINIDMAKGALKFGQRNHELNEIEPGRSRFLGHDIFKSFGKLKKNGPYGIVIVDPPSYQPGSFVAKEDYEKLIRRIPQLLRPGGKSLLCLNAPELNADFLPEIVASAAPELILLERLDNPESFPAADPNRSLKVFVYRLPD